MHLSTQTVRRKLRRAFQWVLLDIIIIITAYMLAYSTRSLFGPLDFFDDFWVVLIATTWTIFVFFIFSIYDRMWSRTSGHGIAILLVAVLTAGVGIYLVDLLVNPRPIPVSVVLLANTFVFIGISGIRYRSRLVSGFSWRWRAVWHGDFPTATKERVLIIGAGESGQTLAWRIKHRFNDNHYELVGFIDDDESKVHMLVEGCPVLGTRTDIIHVVEKKRVDLIIVAIHNISGQNFREILTYCGETRARIKVIPDTLGFINEKHYGQLLRDVQPEDLIGRSPISRHESVDLASVTGKTVLITGAAGSIGSELSRQMATYNPTCLVLLDNNESALHDLTIDLDSRFPDVEVHPVLADITVETLVVNVFEHFKPQVVFHAAAYKHVPMLEYYPGEAVRVNVFGTRRVAELARKHGAERFVLISTDKAVNPTSVMGASKRLCELLVHTLAENNQGTCFTVVRFGNVLGSRGSVVPTFNRQIDNGGPVTVTDPEMTRYFMSIAEAVNLVIHAACLTENDDIFVLRMGELVRIVDIAERMIRLRGLRPYEDIQINFTGIRPGEKIYEELHTQDERPASTSHPHIMKLCGWHEPPESTLFLDALNELRYEDFHEDGHALEALTQLASLSYARVIGMD